MAPASTPVGPDGVRGARNNNKVLIDREFVIGRFSDIFILILELYLSLINSKYKNVNRDL